MSKEFTIPIPGRLKNVAKDGHVAGTEDIYDDELQKTQKEINAETENDITNLDNKVSALQKQDIEVVADHTAVTNPDPKKIYREQGTESYTDYMYQNNAWKELATYAFPGIDDKPTAGSENLVKSGGVYSSTPTVANSTTESDLDISDEDGNVLARFAGGHLQVKNFSSADALESIQAILSNIGFDNVPEFDEETDYAVGDIVRHGKYVYVFTSAHAAGEWDETEAEKTVLTSESQVEIMDGASEADLDISDEQGNVLARFANGNFKTKYFDSSNSGLEYINLLEINI